MVNHNTRCYECRYEEVRDIKSASDEWRGVCPQCRNESVYRVMSAPHIGMTEDQQIDAFQKHCRDRFHKKEIDTVRHKHGTVADEAVRAADIKRIKECLEK